MVFTEVVRNADDFGLNTKINQAIIKAHQMGKIDAVSLMINREGSEEAIKYCLQHPELNVGLHLTPGKCETYKQFLKHYFKNGIIVSWGLAINWNTQFQMIKNTGLKVNRVDSHFGVHFFPKLWLLLMILMIHYEFIYVRNPPRPFCWYHPNGKIWIGKNKSWLFYHINKNIHNPLPYREIICHPK